ncbi:hypothetical protein CEXT_543351 [Caerostris extrusa]|uniref:Uncharacterized protein n=1 Tax=Caerostris extrusa TaxID=172846 RepID=A0AAV4VP24_CAEEX|nr:hypothetical protein CEXT_543351 [Caerostris extrusa]
MTCHFYAAMFTREKLISKYLPLPCSGEDTPSKVQLRSNRNKKNANNFSRQCQNGQYLLQIALHQQKFCVRLRKNRSDLFQFSRKYLA